MFMSLLNRSERETCYQAQVGLISGLRAREDQGAADVPAAAAAKACFL